jgi:hypothetical protein
MERAAVEATVQLARALDQIAALPATPALRREQIRLQVALITPLIHVKGYAAPETKAAQQAKGLTACWTLERQAPNLSALIM